MDYIMPLEPIRVAFVAPRYADGLNTELDIVPEIERISRRVTVVFIRDSVSYPMLYDLFKYEQFDGIHWATHIVADIEGNYSRMLLESKTSVESLDTLRSPIGESHARQSALAKVETIRLEQISQLYGLSRSKFGFFNACNTSMIATYCVQHGLPLAVYTNVWLPDARAWEVAALFYEDLYRQQRTLDRYDYLAAFGHAVRHNQNGWYGLATSSGVNKEMVAAEISSLREQQARAVEDWEAIKIDLGKAVQIAQTSATMVQGVNNHFDTIQTILDDFKKALASLDKRLSSMEARENIYPLQANLSVIAAIGAVVLISTLVGVWMVSLML